ncbi:MAG: hypothetical protein KGQ70_06085, partial [Alphaproteobacteria bacterium]|nr:hypothetical protein [Alphaproteobacteria bacterium]
MKKVSADTITELTASAATVAGAGGTPPTTEELIDKVRASLRAKAKALSASGQRAQETAPPSQEGKRTAFDISYGDAARNLAQFEEILANVPNGFRLVPVLYTTIKHQQNAQIYSQFKSHVRPEFLRFLAREHAGELVALGICQKGIRQMALGRKPVDERNRPYAVNIDHIIERFGGGKASLTKEVDPQMPPGSAPTHLTNHFANLMLMPLAVHDLKNQLNELQGAANTPLGTSKWVLMIVPETGPGHAGYVAQPQTKAPIVAPSRGNSASSRPSGMSALQKTTGTASRLNRLLDEALRTEGAQNINLAPMLESMASSLKDAFNDSATRHHDFLSFQKFYDGRKFADLREKLEALPPVETAKLRDTLQWLDGEISRRFNHGAANRPPADTPFSQP